MVYLSVSRRRLCSEWLDLGPATLQSTTGWLMDDAEQYLLDWISWTRRESQRYELALVRIPESDLGDHTAILTVYPTPLIHLTEIHPVGHNLRSRGPLYRLLQNLDHRQYKISRGGHHVMTRDQINDTLATFMRAFRENGSIMHAGKNPQLVVLELRNARRSGESRRAWLSRGMN